MSIPEKSLVNTDVNKSGGEGGTPGVEETMEAEADSVEIDEAAVVVNKSGGEGGTPG